MRRGLILVLAVLGIASGAVASAGAVQICLRTSVGCGVPNLVATFGGSVSPLKLPENEYAPVTASVFGKIGTANGAHPPALREVEFDIDKDVKINVKGYPVCGGIQLEERGPRAAMKACSGAFLGEGRANVEIAATEGAPTQVSSRLLIFNGGEESGMPKLLAYTFVSFSTPTAIVTRIAVQKGGTGLHTVAKIPVIAEGMGSLLDFKFKLGKTYSYKGKKVGYFEARCPDGVFKANVKKILFKNEAHTAGEGAQTSLKGAFAVPCTPQG